MKMFSKRLISGLLVAGVLALGSSHALAQAIKTSGSIAVGAGQTNLQSQGKVQGFDMVGEASINFAIKQGEFDGQVELGVADDPNQALDTARHEMKWALKKDISVTMSGYGFGIESVQGNVSVVNAPAGPVGDLEANLDFSDMGLVNGEMTSGAMVFGVGISDKCVPDCGYTIDVDGNIISAESENSTMVLHGRGKSDKVNFNGYYTISSGLYLADQQKGQGQAIGGGFAYDGGSFTAAGDYVQATVVCNPNMNCGSNLVTTAMGVGFTSGAIGGHYHSESTVVGTASVGVTNMDLVYSMPMGKATVSPEYRSVTYTFPGSSITDTFILVGMSMDF